MTLLEMSVLYAESADKLRGRIAQLRAAERADRTEAAPAGGEPAAPAAGDAGVGGADGKIL